MAMSLTFRSAVVGAMPSAKLLQAKSTTRVSATVKVRIAENAVFFFSFFHHASARMKESERGGGLLNYLSFNNLRKGETPAGAGWTRVRVCVRGR